MRFFLDLVSVSPLEIASDMFLFFAPWLIGGAVVVIAGILIAKIIKNKK